MEKLAPCILCETIERHKRTVRIFLDHFATHAFPESRQALQDLLEFLEAQREAHVDRSVEGD